MKVMILTFDGGMYAIRIFSLSLQNRFIIHRKQKIKQTDMHNNNNITPSRPQKRAVVMGATSGIGLEVARQLAAEGWLVGIAGRRTGRLEQIEAETDGIVAHASIDVTADDAPERLMQLIETLGGIDLYVHSAGIGWQNEALDEQKELLTMGTNAMGFVRMVDAAFNHFARHAATQSGHIACITSIARTRGLGAAPAYSAAKRMQSHYLECLDQLARMRRLPITITDIRPGFVATDLIAGSHYPLQLSASSVAQSIIKAIRRRRSTVVIDWRYRLLVAVWSLVPRWLWVRMRIGG